MKQEAHERLKFIDESGVTTTLTRRFGRAAPRVRVVEAVPKNYGSSTSVVSVIGVGGVETAMVIEGALDPLVFDALCETFLRPCVQAATYWGGTIWGRTAPVASRQSPTRAKPA